MERAGEAAREGQVNAVFYYNDYPNPGHLTVERREAVGSIYAEFYSDERLELAGVFYSVSVTGAILA